MHPNTQAFGNQSRRFSQLVLQSGLLADPYGKDRPSPKALLDFIEELLVCPTEDAVKSLIAEYAAAAHFWRGTFGDTTRASDIDKVLAAIDRPAHETPFYVVASVLLRRARLAVEQLDENWKAKRAPE